jgi:hypothetical protein
LLIGKVCAKPPSHAGDSIVEPMLAVKGCGMMFGCGVLATHADDGAVEVTLVVARCHCRVMLDMALLSLASDSAAKVILAMA